MELNDCIRGVRERVEAFVEQEKLFDRQSRLLVGVSGGADSVMLLDLLVHARFQCEVVHCNFHLRGDESDRDEQFVTSLCRSYGVPLHVAHFDTLGEANRRGVSVEMAARDLRYDLFERYCHTHRLTHVAVAHHRDDSIETLLLNLVRGTGIRGLTGIAPCNGRVVRPLLCLSREEILCYIRERRLMYVTDSTNADDYYRRNKIRLRLLPLLEEMNPSVREALVHTSRCLTDVCRVYESSVESARADCLVETAAGVEFSITRILSFSAPASLVYELLRPYGFSPTVADELYRSFTALSGKQFLSASHRVVKDRDRLIVAPLSDPSPKAISLSIDSPPLIEPLGLQWSVVDMTPDFVIPRDLSTACFDLDKLGLQWVLRVWQEGDWFIPFGMKGRKKVSDYFIDRKLSLPEKQQARLLCTADGSVAWIVGQRIDARFAVDRTTRRIVLFQLLHSRSVL